MLLKSLTFEYYPNPGEMDYSELFGVNPEGNRVDTECLSLLVPRTCLHHPAVPTAPSEPHAPQDTPCHCPSKVQAQSEQG